MLLAVDTVGAGVRENVLIVLDGKAAGDAMRRAHAGRCRSRYRGPRRLRSRAHAAMTEEELRHMVRRVVADRLGSSPQASGAHASRPCDPPDVVTRSHATFRSDGSETGGPCVIGLPCPAIIVGIASRWGIEVRSRPSEVDNESPRQGTIRARSLPSD